MHELHQDLFQKSNGTQENYSSGVIIRLRTILINLNVSFNFGAFEGSWIIVKSTIRINIFLKGSKKATNCSKIAVLADSTAYH